MKFKYLITCIAVGLISTSALAKSNEITNVKGDSITPIDEVLTYTPPSYMAGVFKDAKFDNAIDGDTIDFTYDIPVANSETKSINIRCRVFGIDTPESKKGRKLNNDIAGTNFTKEYELDAGNKSKEYAIKYFSQSPTWTIYNYGLDVYGRTLCLIANYNIDILADGYAVVYKYGSSTHDEGLKEVLNKAQKAGLNKGLNVTHRDLMDHIRNN